MVRSFYILMTSLGAATAVQAAPLAWDQCVDLVKKNNHELISQTALVEAARSREGSAVAGYFPQVTGGLSYSRSGTEAPTSSESEGYGAQIELNQNLFTGFADHQRGKQAQANTRAAEKDLQALKARLSRDLKTTFENLRHAERSISLQESILKRRQENVRLVELKYQGGRENKGSLLLSRANLSGAKIDLLQAKLSLRMARTALAKILGMDETESLTISGEAPSSPAPDAAIRLRPLALGTPAVERAQAAEESAQAGLSLSRSAFYPSLGLNARVGRGDEEFFPERDKNWSVGVSLSFPLFSGGRDYYETRAQGKNLLSSIHQRMKVQQESLVNLENTLSDFLITDEKVRLNTELVEAQGVRAEISRMKYNNGLMSFEDWDGVENALINQQKAHLDSVRDRVHKEAAWEEAQGKDLLQ